MIQSMSEPSREQFVDQVIAIVKARFPLVKLARADQSFSLKLNGHIAAKGKENDPEAKKYADLAAQIRESRHATPPLAWWETPLPRPWGTLGLATGLGYWLWTIYAWSNKYGTVPVPVEISIEPAFV